MSRDSEQRQAHGWKGNPRAEEEEEGRVCQVEGCGAKLSQLKEYHLRYKICETHLRAEELTMSNGTRQRFCQQCGRFHLLTAFHESRRSCRDGLLKHQERRRRKVATLRGLASLESGGGGPSQSEGSGLLNAPSGADQNISEMMEDAAPLPPDDSPSGSQPRPSLGLGRSGSVNSPHNLPDSRRPSKQRKTGKDEPGSPRPLSSSGRRASKHHSAPLNIRPAASKQRSSLAHSSELFPSSPGGDSYPQSGQRSQALATSSFPGWPMFPELHARAMATFAEPQESVLPVLRPMGGPFGHLPPPMDFFSLPIPAATSRRSQPEPPCTLGGSESLESLWQALNASSISDVPAAEAAALLISPAAMGPQRSICSTDAEVLLSQEAAAGASSGSFSRESAARVMMSPALMTGASLAGAVGAGPGNPSLSAADPGSAQARSAGSRAAQLQSSGAAAAAAAAAARAAWGASATAADADESANQLRAFQQQADAGGSADAGLDPWVGTLF